MSEPLPIEARNAIRGIFANTDAEVAASVLSERLHRGTALCVLKQFALEVEKVDKNFGAELVALHTEGAVNAGGYGG